MKTLIQTNKRFIFTQKELKEKLGLEGDIIKIDLWRGLSPNEEANKIPKDNNEYYFEIQIGSIEP